MQVTLYKKDSKGKTRVLILEASNGELIQLSGLIDGQLVEHRKTCKPKNIGKINATNPQEQAESELLSKVKDKLYAGYFESLEDLNEADDVIMPMLAKDYKSEKNKIKWADHVYAQPKLDGMRCLVFIKDGIIKMMSRDGKTISTVSHIEESLKIIKDDIILDGELYCHGKTFQENMKLIKKYRKGLSEEVQYHIYDCVENEPFHKRYNTIKNLVESTSISNVVLVKTTLIKDEKELQDQHQINLSDNFEGTIIRHGLEDYKSRGRSSNLLKYKDFKDIALPLLDVVAADQRPEWGVPVFEINGTRFQAGTRLTHDERIALLSNKDNFIGKTGEIRFFEYTDGGIPRFPVLVGFRLDK